MRLIHYCNQTPPSEPIPACPGLSGKLFREGWEASFKILTPPRNIYPVLLLFLLNYFWEHSVSLFTKKIPEKSSRLHYFIHHLRNWQITTNTNPRMLQVRLNPIFSTYWNPTREWFQCCCCSLCSAIQSTWSFPKLFRTASTAMVDRIFRTATLSCFFCRHRS